MFDRRSSSRAALVAAALAVLVGRVHGTIALEWTAGDGGGDTWDPRYGHAAVCFDDGVVVTTGGSDGTDNFGDVCSTAPGGTAPTTCVTPISMGARRGHAITRVPGSADAFAVAGGTAASGDTGRKHVLLTVDRGATFSEIGGNNALGKGAVYLGLVAPDATTFVAFGGKASGLFSAPTFYNFVRRSTDSGATWATIRAEGGGGGECATSPAMWSERYGFGYAFMPGQDRIVVAGGRSAAGNEQDVWSSDDHGVCWVRLTFDLTAGGLTNGLVGAALVVFSLSNGQEVLVLAGGTRGLLVPTTLDNVYRSVDFGAAWEPVAILTTSTGWSARTTFALVYNPLNANLVALGGLSGATTAQRVNSVCTADVTRVRTAACAAALCASRPTPRAARSALRPIRRVFTTVPHRSSSYATPAASPSQLTSAPTKAPTSFPTAYPTKSPTPLSGSAAGLWFKQYGSETLAQNSASNALFVTLKNELAQGKTVELRIISCTPFLESGGSTMDSEQYYTGLGWISMTSDGGQTTGTGNELATFTPHFIRKSYNQIQDTVVQVRIGGAIGPTLAPTTSFPTAAPTSFPSRAAPSAAPTSAPTQVLGSLVNFNASVAVSEDAGEGGAPSATLLVVNAGVRAAESEIITVACEAKLASRVRLVDATPITIDSSGARGGRVGFSVVGVWDSDQLVSRSTTVECRVTSSVAAKVAATLTIPVTILGVAQPSIRSFCTNTSTSNCYGATASTSTSLTTNGDVS